MSLEIGRHGAEVQIDASETALEHQLRAIADVRLRVGADGRIAQASLARPGDIVPDGDPTPIGADVRAVLEPLVPEIGDLVYRALTTGDSQLPTDVGEPWTDANEANDRRRALLRGPSDQGRQLEESQQTRRAA